MIILFSFWMHRLPSCQHPSVWLTNTRLNDILQQQTCLNCTDLIQVPMMKKKTKIVYQAFLCLRYSQPFFWNPVSGLLYYKMFRMKVKLVLPTLLSQSELVITFFLGQYFIEVINIWYKSHALLGWEAFSITQLCTEHQFV